MGMIGISIGLNKVAGGSAVTFPLDGIATPRAVYSTRRLLTSYTGDCVKLRRSSDNAEADFGFDANGDLDTTAILLWLGGSSAYLVTWYDQSGNGHDGVQATTGEQPNYVESGLNSCPAFVYDGVTRHDNFDLPDGALASLAACTIFVVYKGDVGSVHQTIVGLHDTANNERQFLFRVRSSNQPLIRFGGTVSDLESRSSTTVDPTNTTVYTGRASNGSLMQLWINGVEPVYASQANAATLLPAFSMNPSIGRTIPTDLNNDISGVFPELIIFETALADADRGAIETNMIAKWIS
jgi:hypothetical protein